MENNDRGIVREVLAVAFSVFVFLALGSALVELCGCVPVRDTTCSRVFRDELLACVEKAQTRDESQRCRELVELRWGYPHE